MLTTLFYDQICGGVKMDLRSIVPDKVSTPAKLFLIGGILNGFGNGIFNVVVQLYFMSIGFDSVTLGTAFMTMALGQAVLTIPSGIFADRYGKVNIMIFGIFCNSVGAILLLTTKNIDFLIVSFLLLGLGNAAFVVMGPLYSSFFSKEDMDRAFGLQGFLNIIFASMGSLMGLVPPVLMSSYGFTLQDSYLAVMTIAAGFALPSMPFFLLSAREGIRSKREAEAGFRFNLRSKGIVAKFCLIRIINTIGFGAFFNLFPYYVNKKFGVQSDALGILYFASNFIQAGANIVAPRISRRFGTLKTIAASIGLCTPFYLMISLAPNFTWLSAFYILRLGVANISSPLAGSLFMKLLYEEEKSTATSFSVMASMGGDIVAPRLGGQLMEQVSLDFPAYLGSGLYIVYAASYYFLLRNEKEKEVEQTPLKAL